MGLITRRQEEGDRRNSNRSLDHRSKELEAVVRKIEPPHWQDVEPPRLVREQYMPGTVKSDLSGAAADSECAVPFQRSDVDNADSPVTWMARVQQAMIGADGQRDRAGLI